MSVLTLPERSSVSESTCRQRRLSPMRIRSGSRQMSCNTGCVSLHTESQVSFNQPGTFFRSDNLFSSKTLHPDMPRIVHDTLELLHRLQKFHDRIPVRDFLGKDMAAAQGTEITAAAGAFAWWSLSGTGSSGAEIRAFVEMTLIAAGQETFRPVSFAPVVFLDEPVLLCTRQNNWEAPS